MTTPERGIDQHGVPAAAPPSFLAAVRRALLPILLLGALAGGAAFQTSQGRAEVFQARSSATLTNPETTTVFGGSINARDLERLTAEAVERARADDVLTRTAAVLGTEWTPGQVRRAVTVRGDTDTSQLEFRALAGTRTEAALLANAYLESFAAVAAEDERDRTDRLLTALDGEVVELEARADDLLVQREARRDTIEAEVVATFPADEVTRELDRRLRLDQAYTGLDRELDVVLGEISDLRSQSRRLAIDARLRTANLISAEPAEEPSAPIGPQPRRDAVIAATIVMALAAAGAWLLAERRGPRLDVAAVAERLARPVLGRIPEQGRGPSTAPVDPLAEHRYVAAYDLLDGELRARSSLSLALVSTLDDACRTTSAVNLARVAAARGQRVLVVDADLRASTLTRDLGLQDRAGWSNLASGGQAVDDAIVEVRLPGGLFIDVVPNGTERAFPESEILARRLRQFANDYDVVLVDTPELGTPEADLVARAVDRLVPVVARTIDNDDVTELVASVVAADRPVLGVLGTRTDHGTTVGLLRSARRVVRRGWENVMGRPWAMTRRPLTRAANRAEEVPA